MKISCCSSFKVPENQVSFTEFQDLWIGLNPEDYVGLLYSNACSLFLVSLMKTEHLQWWEKKLLRVTYLSIWMSFLPIYFQNEWETSYNNVYPHNGTLFSNKRERQADRRSKTDQVQKHAMQKKLETKDHILHNSVHRKCPEKTNT